jgi:hypothetical protein
MSFGLNRLIGWVAVAAALGPGFGFGQEPHSARGVLGNKKAKRITPPSTAGKVMPPDAIVVIDPWANRKEERRPVLRESADGNGLAVDVPEVIHVHQYFPGGRREFQAQYFAGGPTIVTATHPSTCDRVYVSLNLPSGFPKVKYDEDEIAYEYPDESYCLYFHKDGSVSTSYNRCGAAKVWVREKHERVKNKSMDCGERLGVNKVVERVGKEAGEVAHGTIDRTGQFVVHSGNMFVGALNLVPGYKTLKSAAEERATRYRDQAVQRAARERQRADEYIKAMP